MKSLLFRSILSVACLSAAMQVLPETLHAQTKKVSAATVKAVKTEPNEQVTLRVRMVQADGKVDPEQVQSPAGQKKRKQRQRSIDKRIRDLAGKLKELPYKSYALISSKRVQIPVKERQTISLRGGQSLFVRLLYVNNKRTGMWLRWEDSAGTELLDTRMHFNCSESMLTGTENGKDSGLILAVNVER